MRNAELLIKLADLLIDNIDDIAQANTDDVQTSFKTNRDNVLRAVASLRAFSKKYPDSNNNLQGVSIYSCYGDPSFGIFGMALAPAIMATGQNVNLLIGLPEILNKYGRLIEKLLVDSKLLPNISFVFGAKEFMNQSLSDDSIKHTLIFGDRWVNKYVDSFKGKKSLTFYGAGNNTAVILPNANFDDAVDKILQSAFILSGQAAVCINRCIIDERVDKQMIENLFKQKLKNITCGFDTKRNYVTPIIIPPLVKMATERLTKFDDAKLTNYSVTKQGNAYLISPTLAWLDDTNEAIWKEYHFAPILPIVFKDFNSIANEVNDTEYGIYTSVWGANNEMELLNKQIAQEHIFVLNNQSVLDIITTDSGYTEGWGGYKNSGFCLSKQTDWQVKHGAFNFYDTILG